MVRNRKAAILAVMMSFAVTLCMAGPSPVRHAADAAASGYRIIKTIAVGGEGGWDYVTVDSEARRVYVSHATHVVILDADSGAKVGDIPNTQGVHGIALAPEFGRGFVSNGKTNTVTIFDMRTYATIGIVNTGGQNPDAIYYDAATKRVFAFNGRSGTAAAINAADGKLVGSVPIGGKLEFAAGAGDGRVFVNIEDKSEMAEIDAQKLMVRRRWPLAPCVEPSGLAMDAEHRRLFAVCDNRVMAVVNADTGKVVARPAIGEAPDAAGFDPETQYAFSSNGQSGTLTVIHEDTPDRYTVVDTVLTKRYARTMAVDLRTHNIFLPAAEFEGTAAPGERRPPIRPGTFQVLVVGR